MYSFRKLLIALGIGMVSFCMSLVGIGPLVSIRGGSVISRMPYRYRLRNGHALQIRCLCTSSPCLKCNGHDGLRWREWAS